MRVAVWSFIVRHRVTIQDLGLLAFALLVVGYLLFEIDVFMHEGETSSSEQQLELNEIMLLGSLLTIGLLIFGARRYIEQKREIARRLAAEREARILAYQDPLTGLANRRQFEEALRTALASPPEAGSSHAVFLLDLNGFKSINDTHGHNIGDEVLVIVAQRLLRAVRDGDLVARLGGDEFVVLARHLIGPEAATSIALRIIAGLSEQIATGSLHHHVGAGIGIALLPEDAETLPEAMRKADVALYRAKAERRSSLRFFEADMDRLVRERDEMERRLKSAMAGDEIHPHFRASFDIETGRIVGFEAIPHWRIESGEEIPAERFLPIAEETGLVHALARRTLELACAAARDWPQDVRLSIDILPGQLKDRHLSRAILDVLETAGLPPQRLEVEIAESTIVRDLEAAKAALQPLREAGVGIALDNFGTGYSSIYHMQEFRIDKVKIDRRLTDDLGGEDAGRLVRALAGLGQGLGLTVSAEATCGGDESALIGSGIQHAQRSAEPVSREDARRLFA